ncbi:transcriptional activator hap3 [Coemansia sp. RSA 1722]|nr:transcriptional activator hap3 [Coemansia sp. RSA 486]KAJ2233361.1 transcriptional activator hap3 [Coemansia sp. RSA 485]KAJ2599518.1 transcriptional activator hap3 [Coemansia sp. RSA 1722]KAJ2601564.1 transcriptional activator hap3 [Coemansia sp. RSA 1721]KAJ2639352.1 transcriptional activator hap3 [Coemansia sp. RSA 1286]KAJ2702561.1 transcriptional activator hap3 [Coemansia sp. IMI 203386]
MSTNDHMNAGDEYEDIKEQDRFLPIANVARIMKRALPDNAKIAKEAKETVQECVSEFISFITSEASDRCHQEKRKTINGEDILWAMQSLGFENYTEALKIYLNKYRESVKVEKDVPHKDESAGLTGEEGSPGIVGSSSAAAAAAAVAAAAAAANVGNHVDPMNVHPDPSSLQAYMGQQQQPPQQGQQNPYYS